MYSGLKRLIVGRPLPSSDEQHQRLGRPTALAVYASDAISSTAYATEEILLVLVPVAGLAALNDLVPISIVVTLLLIIVISSYRQTIFAYPGGGGSYVVSRQNLGENPSLVAGSALLVDYILTVAVSVSAGVAAITSAFPSLIDERVPMCLGFIGLMTLANLRGLKEAGRLFAGPTYMYVVSMATLIVVGIVRNMTGSLDALPPNEEALRELTNSGQLLTGLTVFAALRAFSSGAVALTGVEAISNGVPTFRKPEAKNAASTLVAMGLILGIYFFGISVLAKLLKPTVTEDETLLSIMGTAVFGDGSVLYLILQFSTFAILILAANTAFAGFPGVSSIIAADGFLPRQLANRGDRLVFSNGILALAAVAGALIVAFDGETSALIPLYAVGVFTGFTLSQLGMVIHHRREQAPGWRRNQVINMVGAISTAIVLLVVVISKFTIGAWIPVVLIPLIVVVFKAVARHYRRVRAAMVVPPDYRVGRHAHTVVVLVSGVNRGVLHAVAYARSMAPDRVIAISVVTNAEEARRLGEAWAEYEVPIELRTVYSPYRDLVEPVMQVIEEIDAERADDVITVVLPEFIVEHWWEQVLHNQSALILRARLRDRPNTAVTSLPIHLREHAPGTKDTRDTQEVNRD